MWTEETARSSLLSRGLYIAGCLAFLAAGAWITLRSWQSTIASPGIERLYFRTLIERHETDYLLRLRDTHLGCETVTYRDPDVVFLGDSHSYAGWDYLKLQQRLRPLAIGNCALSGMFPENVEDFAGLVAAAGLSTRFVIFGVQPRMFWDVPERPDRVARARRMMIEVREPRESLPGMARGEWRQIDTFIGSASTELAKIDRLRAGAQHLDAHTVDRGLADNERSLYALDYWLGYIRDGRPMPGIQQMVDRTCRALARVGVRLGVVYIPESRWLNERYTHEQRDAFIRDARQFEQCADWVDLSAFDSYGFDNRYFVNRYLVDNYPYAGWRDVTLAHQWINESATARRWQFFDPDHLSAAGAGEFSARMVPQLSRWITGQPGGDQ